MAWKYRNGDRVEILGANKGFRNLTVRIVEQMDRSDGTLAYKVAFSNGSRDVYSKEAFEDKTRLKR